MEESLGQGNEQPKKPKTKKKSSQNRTNDNFPKLTSSSSWNRTTDQDNNVYYVNSVSGVSAWLAPCSVCSLIATKWCIECAKSYCDKDYDVVHIELIALGNHTASPTERFTKDEIQPNEIYCIRCNVKAACRICTDCWDPYCSECFKAVHCVGNLKTHKAVAYQRAKLGWTCERSSDTEQPDKYIDGSTGKVTTEKPFELMSELERVYLKNFKLHKEAADDYAKQIDDIQQELQSVKFERDNLIVGSLGKTPIAVAVPLATVTKS